MNLVLEDVIHCERLELNLPSTPLSRGETHSSIEENIKALCEQNGIQLIEYDSIQRFRIKDRVHVRIYSLKWRSRYQ